MKYLAPILALLLLGFLPASAKPDEREYPTSGTVYAKIKGISAKHVTEASGEDAEIKSSYYVCIQRNPRRDRYVDNWLAYRQCWDTTKEVFDAVEICDWFQLKDPQIKDQATRPDDKTFRKQRRLDARAIKRFDACN